MTTWKMLKKYINPAFMTNRSNEILNFLGVGMPDNYSCVPQSNIRTVSNNFLLVHISKIILELFKRIFKLTDMKRKISKK